MKSLAQSIVWQLEVLANAYIYIENFVREDE